MILKRAKKAKALELRILFHFRISSRIVLVYRNFVCSGEWKAPRWLASIVANSLLKQQPPSEQDAAKCNVCGDQNCDREKVVHVQKPWAGLNVPKEIDAAVESVSWSFEIGKIPCRFCPDDEFFRFFPNFQLLERCLEEYVQSWYTKVSLDSSFPTELRQNIRYAASVILNRLLEVAIFHEKFIFFRCTLFRIYEMLKGRVLCRTWFLKMEGDPKLNIFRWTLVRFYRKKSFPPSFNMWTFACPTSGSPTRRVASPTTPPSLAEKRNSTTWGTGSTKSFLSYSSRGIWNAGEWRAKTTSLMLQKLVLFQVLSACNVVLIDFGPLPPVLRLSRPFWPVLDHFAQFWLV